MSDPETDQPNLGGRPPHEPTKERRDQVETLSGYGIPQEDIAEFVGVCAQTLMKHYPNEMKLGRIKADAKVAGSLFRKAASDEHPQSTQAAIWWEKTRSGRKEPKQELQYIGNATLKVEYTRKLDISTLTDEQLDALEGALRATVAQMDGPVIEHED